MKECTKCKSQKNLEDFHRRITSKDGRTNKCKICQAEYQRKIYEEKGDVYLNKLRLINNDGIKTKARGAVSRALRDGKLIKQKCQVNTCTETIVHAHHLDYSKKLEIIWLCVKHHEAIHHKYD